MINMRSFIHCLPSHVAFLLLIFPLSLWAQPEEGTVSIVPRVGLSVASVNDDLPFVAMGNENTEDGKSEWRTGLTAGVDLHWQVRYMFSLSAGAHWARLGAKYADTQLDQPQPGTYHAISSSALALDALVLPVQAHLHFVHGLAVHAGVAALVPVDAKLNYTEQEVNVSRDGAFTYSEPQQQSRSQRSIMRSFGLSVPIGLSWEYQQVVVDATYHWGLQSIYKLAELDHARPRTFLLTVGYRINL